MNDQKYIDECWQKAIKAKDSKNYPVAKRWFCKVIEENSKLLQCWILVASCDFELGNYSEALRSFRKAERLSPKDWVIQTYIGIVQLELNRPKLAERTLRKSLELKPQAETYSTLCSSLKKQGKTHKAVACLKSALKCDPNYEEAYYNLGVYYSSQNQWVRAEKCFSKAIEIDPRYSLAYGELGNVMLHKKQYRVARRLLRKSIRLSSENYWTHISLATVNWILRKLKEADHEFQEALRLLPKDAWALASYGHFLSSEKRKIEEGEVYLKKALSLSPQNVSIQFFIGKHFLRLGLIDEARIHLRKAARKGHKKAKVLLNGMKKDNL